MVDMASRVNETTLVQLPLFERDPIYKHKIKIRHFKKILRGYASAHWNPHIIQIRPEYCWKIERHLQMFRYFDNINESNRKFSVEDIHSLSYWKYRMARHWSYNDDNLTMFMIRYRNYMQIREFGMTSWPAIVDNGMMVDGMHRLAMTVHWGQPELKINLLCYKNCFGRKKAYLAQRRISDYRDKYIDDSYKSFTLAIRCEPK